MKLNISSFYFEKRYSHVNVKSNPYKFKAVNGIGRKSLFSQFSLISNK